MFKGAKHGFIEENNPEYEKLHFHDSKSPDQEILARQAEDYIKNWLKITLWLDLKIILLKNCSHHKNLLWYLLNSYYFADHPFFQINYWIEFQEYIWKNYFKNIFEKKNYFQISRILKKNYFHLWCQRWFYSIFLKFEKKDAYCMLSSYSLNLSFKNLIKLSVFIPFSLRTFFFISLNAIQLYL